VFFNMSWTFYAAKDMSSQCLPLSPKFISNMQMHKNETKDNFFPLTKWTKIEYCCTSKTMEMLYSSEFLKMCVMIILTRSLSFVHNYLPQVESLKCILIDLLKVVYRSARAGTKRSTIETIFTIPGISINTCISS
jgi:hypothetical protein